MSAISQEGQSPFRDERYNKGDNTKVLNWGFLQMPPPYSQLPHSSREYRLPPSICASA